jgi:hypothetical protein
MKLHFAASSLFILLSATVSLAAEPSVLPGWRSDFEACRVEAEKTGRPLVLVWGAALCAHCRELMADLETNATFKVWKDQKKDYLFCAVRQEVGKRKSKQVKRAKVFAASAGGTRTSQPASFPYVCLFYRKSPSKVWADSFTTHHADAIIAAADRLFSGVASTGTIHKVSEDVPMEEAGVDAYIGNYTVQLPSVGVASNALIRGGACLALDIQPALESAGSALVSYSGVTPDGYPFKGEAPLSLTSATNGAGVRSCFGHVSIMAKTETCRMTLPLKIKPFARKFWKNPSVPEGLPAVFADGGTNSCFWIDQEGKKTLLQVYGGFLRRNFAPRKICDHFDFSPAMKLKVRAKGIESERYGKVLKWPSAKVTADLKNFSVQSSVGNVQLIYASALGMVGGTGAVKFAERSLYGKFTGIVLPGWVDCHCGTEFTARPLVSGSFCFEDFVKKGDAWVPVKRSVPFVIIAK